MKTLRNLPPKIRESIPEGELARACEILSEPEQAALLGLAGRPCGGVNLRLAELARFAVEACEPFRRMKITRRILARKQRQAAANLVFSALDAVKATRGLRTIAPHLEAAAQALKESGYTRAGRGRPGITTANMDWLRDVLAVWIPIFGGFPATNEDSAFLHAAAILWKAEARAWKNTIAAWEGHAAFNDCESDAALFVDWQETLKRIAAKKGG